MRYAAVGMRQSAAQKGADRAAITYLDGTRLRRALRAGIAAVLADQEHLNKINVYPVPDGDTGTNLALTLHAIMTALPGSAPAHAGQFLIAVADAAIDGSRGNSGAILAQFLLGVADYSARSPRLDAAQLAAACASGAAYAREAMSEPVEGTMLTVLDDFARELNDTLATGDTDILSIFGAAHKAAAISLANTPNLLDALRKAGVVDAGAAGFVDLLDGIAGLLHDGIEHELPQIDSSAEYAGEIAAGTDIDLKFRYCTECLVRGEQIERRKLREQLSALGDSLVLAGSHARTRVHIHTNDPDAVFHVAGDFGTVSGQKADDMQRQQELVHARNHAVVVATDTGGDVPDDLADALNIYQTSVRVHFGNESYLDKVSITAQQLYDRLRSSELPPKTSQPPPGDFRRQFQFLASHYEEVVSINLTSRASGTFQAAETAAHALDDSGRVHVIDSKNASLGQGLLVIDAAEAAQAGCSGAEVRSRIETMIPRTLTFGALSDLEYGVRGGRVAPWVKRVADTLHLTPVLGNTPDGEVKPVGVLFGRRNVVTRFARFVLRRVSDGKTYRLAVGHADCEEDGRRLLAALEAGIPLRHQTFFTRIGTALGVHTGPAGLVVGLQEYLPLERELKDVENPG